MTVFRQLLIQSMLAVGLLRASHCEKATATGDTGDKCYDTSEFKDVIKFYKTDDVAAFNLVQEGMFPQTYPKATGEWSHVTSAGNEF